MTEELEIRIPARELVKISLRCVCGAEITIDMSVKIHRETDWEHKGLTCPMCPKMFDAQVKLALGGFSIWYDQLSNSGTDVTFRVGKTMIAESGN